MTSIRIFIRRYPVTVFYALTFAISWGGILLVIVRFGGIPATKEQLAAMMTTAIPALLGGPSIAGLLLTGLVHGKEGFRNLFSRLLMWRFGMRWYAAAVLIGPLVLFAELLALSLYSSDFLPGIFASGDKMPRLTLAIAAGLGAGIFEELGWTGFAIPELRRRFGILATGLVVGVLWGAWHIPANAVLACVSYSGELSPAVFISARGFGDLVGILPAFRILMVWVYDRTGSLFIAMLMHVGLTFATILFEPQDIAGIPLVIYDIASTVAMWMVVAAVAAALGWRLTQPQRAGRKASRS